MNRILFDREEISPLLVRTDPRAQHLLRHIRVQQGDQVKVGIINGEKGVAKVIEIRSEGLILHYSWEDVQASLPLLPITAVIAHPRPPCLHRLIRDLCSMGICELRVCIADSTEKSYQQSHVWQPELLQKSLIEGAAQAGETRLSTCGCFASLAAALDGAPAYALQFQVGDDMPFLASIQTPLCYIIGPERHWSMRERDLLASRHAISVGLGPRILRTETASIAAASLIIHNISARLA